MLDEAACRNVREDMVRQWQTLSRQLEAHNLPGMRVQHDEGEKRVLVVRPFEHGHARHLVE